MKMQKRLSLLTSAILVLVLAAPATAKPGGKSTFQAANFHDFPDATEPQPSAGTLTRTKESIHANLALSGLDLGAAYTVWWIIWNKPKECAAIPCGLGDLGVKGNAIIYATGFVTAESGAANVTADLVAGKLPKGMFVHPVFPGELKRGNGFRVEAHMLVQTHGMIWPRMVDIQISVDGGACNPPTVPPEPSSCKVQQAIMFLP